MYIQAGYFFIPKEWEIASRFGYLHSAKETFFERIIFGLQPKEVTEYSLQLAKYIDGHWLKIQTGPTWYNGKDTLNPSFHDQRWDLQITGNF